jgi:phosphoribosylformylglycinamidine synthase
VPVADVGVTLSDYVGYTGEAMAMGERSPVALLNPRASGRLAVAEAITNIVAADVRQLTDIRLSANWMAACGEPGEDADLYDTVRAVGAELCSELGITIPVGKDSLSMRTRWSDAHGEHSVVSPVSLVISAFAPVGDARATLTPELRRHGSSRLLLIDLGRGQNRLGGSCWAQVHELSGGVAPDLDEPQLLRAYFTALREIKDLDLALAYHDRSDGGLLITLLEMAFAAHCGLDIDLGRTDDVIANCFAEELGAVIQTPLDQVPMVFEILERLGLRDCCRDVGTLREDQTINIRANRSPLYTGSRVDLQRMWSETSFRIQELRDNPLCALQEFDRILDAQDPGLHATLTFDVNEDVAAPYISSGARPAIAITREQGVNSQVEMAAVFTRAGFDAYDVHMTDILSGRVSLSRFAGVVACGGFSFGDVLGAGEGWAKSILFNSRLRDEFSAFFERNSTFTLGVCNGCQMLAALKELIPGAENWPQFVTNASERYEARLGLVEVPRSRSVLMAGMHGSVLPIVVAHGEGRADTGRDEARQLIQLGLTSLRFVDHRGAATEHYPQNPNGSPLGLAGLTSMDGRVTALMPHPERVYRSVQNSWRPHEWSEDGGWMRMFRNARVFLG